MMQHRSDLYFQYCGTDM